MSNTSLCPPTNPLSSALGLYFQLLQCLGNSLLATLVCLNLNFFHLPSRTLDIPFFCLRVPWNFPVNSSHRNYSGLTTSFSCLKWLSKVKIKSKLLTFAVNLGHLASVSDLTCSTRPLENYAPDQSLLVLWKDHQTPPHLVPTWHWLLFLLSGVLSLDLGMVCFFFQFRLVLCHLFGEILIPRSKAVTQFLLSNHHT